MVDPSGKTSLASNRTIAAAASRYFSRSLIFPVSLSFNAEVVVQVPYSSTFVIEPSRDGRMLRFCAVLLEVRSVCWRAIVIPLNEAPASRSALNRKTNSRERRLSMSNSTYRLIALVWRQLTGQVYCDAFSAAGTDDYQVNDLTAALSTQRVLQIGDVARTLAVDSND
jgi:hypothetical protein